METIFTASDGTTIRTERSQSDGRVRWYLYNKEDRCSVYLRDTEMPTLREYFQAEKDRRLGWWRWPENPDYVVYPNPHEAFQRIPGLKPDLMIFCELDGSMWGYFHEADQGGAPGPIQANHVLAARAYFDAHPKPKPWHKAKPGEVWALTVDVFDPRGVEDAFITERRDDQMVFVPLRQSYAVSFIGVKATGITAGHRIWPEVAS